MSTQDNTSERTIPQVEDPPQELDKLTIGVEIEFLMIRPINDEEDAGGNETGLRMVREALSSALFEKRCNTCGHVHKYHLPLSNIEDDIETIAKCWTVTHDFTVGIPWPQREKLGENYRCHGIEVKSRAFVFDEPTPCENSDHHGGKVAHQWQLELQTVLDALQDLGRREDFRVFVNPSTGFHVHVGNGTKGINTKVARCLVGMFTAFERQFDSISTTQRIGGGGKYADEGYPKIPDPPGKIRNFEYESDNKYVVQENMGFFCKPMSAIHITNAEEKQGAHAPVVSANPPLEERMDIGSWLQLIRERKTATELKNLAGRLNSWHATVINLERIWDADSVNHEDERDDVEDFKAKPTIEFRSHAGTLGFQEQVSWIRVVAHLVKFCYAHGEKDIFESLGNSWCRYHCSFVNVLKDIGAEKDLRDHYSRVLHDGEGSWASIRAKQQRYLEVKRVDHIRRTGIVDVAIGEEFKFKELRAVNQKIKNKFLQGLYGQYHEDVVQKFLKDLDDYGAYERGEVDHLILRDVASR